MAHINARTRDYLATLYTLPAGTDVSTLVMRWMATQAGNMNARWIALKALI